jgi:CheY-like chemotaxis protein
VEHPAGDYVVLSVIDNGRGMSSEVVDHVFEPFYTTKATGKGTGLGLATVYGIVRQHDGFIELQSEPKRGTSFRIYFPRQFGSVELEPLFDSKPTTQARSETLLVVEDEATLRAIATSMLRRLGYNVLCAALPSAALELVRQYPAQIQLLVTDVVMPEMNGRDLWQNLRMLQPQIRCLYMSGYSADVLGEEGVLSADTHFIQKPFTLSALDRKTREALL